jgi:hypothetical protein
MGNHVPHELRNNHHTLQCPDIVRLLQAVERICEQNRMTILRLAAVERDNYGNYGNSGKMAFRQKIALQ